MSGFEYREKTLELWLLRWVDGLAGTERVGGSRVGTRGGRMVGTEEICLSERSWAWHSYKHDATIEAQEST